MAIFGTKKEEKKDDSVVVEKKAFHVAKRKGRRQTTSSNYANNPSAVLLRPRITEKATLAIEKKTYVFEVATNATKRDIENAVEHYYKVKPVKINIAKIPSKKRMSRTKRTFGIKPAGKKAYVYLKEGDSIEFI